jgi:preprotein translocase subunit SecB
MSDKSKSNPTPEQPAAQPGQENAPLIVNGQYIKDLSFEVPGAPAIFSQLTSPPEIPISVDIRVNRLGDNVYEVVLHLKIDAHSGDKPVFIAELDYAGVFTVNVPEEHVEPMLTIEAPRLLFPFARNIIADVTRDGGLPPLMLQPVDFVGIYRQRVEARAAEGGPVGHA